MRNELRKKAPPRPSRKSREEHARDTRDALLKAALQVVSKHGYARASVSRITQASGVAQGTLYSYFQSHQQLLDELLPAEGVRLLDVLGKSAHRSQDYFDHERRTFSAFAAYMKSKPYFLRVLTEAEIAAPESFAQHMRNVENRYLGALHRAQEQGEIRPHGDRSFRVIAEVLSGARGHIAIGFSDRSGARAFRPELPDWAADSYVKFVRHGLGVDAGEAPKARRPRAKPRSKPTDTRSLLLESAARVVHHTGYEAATVQAITQGAGVAVGTFYAHFQSRQQLFDELLAHVRTDMLAHVTDAVRGSRSFAEVEARGFQAFFDYLVHSPWYIRIETEAAVWAPATYLRHFFDIADRYVVALRRGKEQGELRSYEDRELPVLAYILMASRHYLATRYMVVSPTPKRLPSWVADSYLDLMHRGLAA